MRHLIPLLCCCVCLPSLALASDAGFTSWEPHRTGRFDQTITGLRAGILKRVQRCIGGKEWVAEEQLADQTLVPYDSTLQIVVPETYQPDRPHGIVIYISPGNNKGLPKTIRRHLADQQLIGAAFSNAGNKVRTVIRQTLAVQTGRLLKEHYTIDPMRVYITGYSGGGRVASTTMLMWAYEFSGGFPMGGANPCEPMLFVDGKNKTYETRGRWRRPDEKLLEYARQYGRYVFIAGEKCFNRRQCEMICEGYQKIGYQHVAFRMIPGVGHKAAPADLVLESLETLDRPLSDWCETNLEDAKQHMDEESYLQAFRCARAARMSAADETLRQQAAALEAEARPLAEGAGEEALAKVDTEADRRNFIRRWSGLAVADTARQALQGGP